MISVHHTNTISPQIQNLAQPCAMVECKKFLRINQNWQKTDF